ADRCLPRSAPASGPDREPAPSAQCAPRISAGEARWTQSGAASRDGRRDGKADDQTLEKSDLPDAVGEDAVLSGLEREHERARVSQAAGEESHIVIIFQEWPSSQGGMAALIDRPDES